ncbi:MAG: hypothetical protein RMJ59_02530 [Candidatus Nitrosocaldus sp.]|nr:hypothetical protein [Candidatus Nitrosocaldus sp.]MDW8275244.1 hypothetical protein [Candidatus Nitrosocaldus sp.]
MSKDLDKHSDIEVENYAVGIYPRSQLLVTATRRSSPNLPDLFRKGKQSWMNVQRRAGLTYIADPMIDWDDIFRPFSRVKGISLGPLNRFFETNTFYRRLIVGDALDGYGSITRSMLALDLMKDDRKVVALPDPYTFSMLNENRYYRSHEDYLFAVADMLNAEARALAREGVDVIQLNAPSIAYDFSNGGRTSVDLGIIGDAIARVKKGVKSKVYLYLYFGNVTSIFPRLMEIKVDGIGIDISSTKLASLVDYSMDKTLILGIVDAMNTRIEEIKSTASALDFILDRMDVKHVVLSTNNSLEYLPYRFAVKKLSVLGRITRLLKAKQTGLTP